MQNNEFKKISIENCTYYYFDDTIKFKDSDSDNILLNQKQYENVLVYNISYTTLICTKPLC